MRSARKARTRHGVDDAVDYIAELRQASDLAHCRWAGASLVIGGGMTAIDAAVQSKLLGAEEVTILYRRGQEQMKACRYEQELAPTRASKSDTGLQPKAVLAKRQRDRHRAANTRAKWTAS